MLRHVARLAAAALVVAAAGLGLTAPAHAASCSGAHGVTVVVDFHELGGGAQASCDAGGAGRTALTQLADVGRTLTFVQRQPGFVCRVDGLPSSDPCVNTPPADAYWSLWWSDGKSGRWVYSSSGVGSLQVPDGGYVGLSWQGGSGKAAPGVTPAAHPSAPPSSTPTHHPSSSPTHHAPSSPSSHSGSHPGSPTTSSSPTEGPSATTSGEPTPSDSSPSKQARRHHHASTSPSATPSAGRSVAPGAPEAAAPANPAASDPGSHGGSGLPAWVAPVLVGGLFVAAGAVALVRRKRAGGP